MRQSMLDNTDAILNQHVVNSPDQIKKETNYKKTWLLVLCALTNISSLSIGYYIKYKFIQNDTDGSL